MNTRSPESGPPKPVREIRDSLEEFHRLRVLVVGDFFVDEYVEGEMFEISREGPIPVVRFESRRRAAGAAGNLASSIRNLGARVKVVGLAGDDANGEALREELEEKKIDTSGLLVREGRPTLTYTKFRARVESAPSREILRLDVLPDGPVDRETEDRILEACRRAAGDVDGIIVLDQVHHLVTKRLLDALPEVARGGSRKSALLHGSSREHIGDFHDFDLVIPNDLEASGAVGEPGSAGETSGLTELGERLKASGRHRQVIITLGPDGMAVFPHQGSMKTLPTFADDVVDVTGSGDAVASTALLGNILGWDLETVAWTASQSAAIAISHVGTHHVTREELDRALERREN